MRKSPWRWVLLAFLLGLLPSVVCLAAGPTATMAQYDAALKAVQDKVDSAAESIDNGDNISGEMPGKFAQRVVGGITAVRLPSGGLVVVNLKGLVHAISTVDKLSDDDAQVDGYNGAGARIGWLREEIAAEAASSGNLTPADRDRAISDKILSGPAYASDPVPPPSWTELKMKAFENWLDNALSKLFKVRGPNVNAPNINWRVLMWVFLSILIAAFFVLLVWIISQIIGRRQARARPLSVSTEEKAILEARDKDTLLTMAERHARSGDYRAAFRLVYLATLIVLDTGGILRFDRSKTNWEYVRQLRSTGRQDVYDVLVPLTREFDRIWYGLSPAGPEVYRNAVTEYEKLTETPAVEKVA